MALLHGEIARGNQQANEHGAKALQKTARQQNSECATTFLLQRARIDRSPS